MGPKPVVIDSRPGAGGILAATMVAKSAPDGYTLLIVSPAFPIRAALIPNLPYDTLKDFATLGEIGFSNLVLVVAPQLKAKTV
ncbi:MAG: tripartite tricarboxylate transporter substrate binding protein, partial [Proteobacteria bacterium]|nr:tripartite tricarboxylate transporter substrate binding protein [Pseudomonadota bacterium]